MFLADDGTPGNNQAQNRQFDQACQEIARQINRPLSRDEKRRLHDRITGQNMGYQGIVDAGMELFGGGGGGGGGWRDQRRDRNRGR